MEAKTRTGPGVVKCKAVPIARCRRCKRDHDARSWAALDSIGTMEDGDGGKLELRNCGCGSTLSVTSS